MSESKEVSFNQANEIITCQRCNYPVLRKDMKLFGNRCPRCGYCITCSSD